MRSTRIICRITFDDWLVILQQHGQINISSHALDHIHHARRNVFKQNTLLSIIAKEKPIFIGMQANGLYAPYFRRKNHYLKIICAKKKFCIQIVTFMNVNKLPSIEK